MDDEVPARLRARPRNGPYRRQPRPHPRSLCAAQSDGRLRPDPRRGVRPFGDEQRDRDAGQARHAELLARAGISGGYARPSLHDRGGIRPGRRGPAARRAQPRTSAADAGPGPDQPPDAGMGEHPSLERKPHATGAARGAGHGPARHRHSQPRHLPARARRRLCRRRSRPGRDRWADLHPPGPAHPVHRAAGLSHVERHFCRERLGIGGQGAVQRRPLRRSARPIYIARVPAADARPDAACSAAAAADHDQRHARGVHDGAASTASRARSMPASSPINGIRSASITS